MNSRELNQCNKWGKNSSGCNEVQTAPSPSRFLGRDREGTFGARALSFLRLRGNDRVLYGFCHAELHHLLGWNLDRFARRGVAAGPRFAFLTDKSSDAGDHEHAVLLGLSNSEVRQTGNELLGRLGGQSCSGGEFLHDLRLGHLCCCHVPLLYPGLPSIRSSRRLKHNRSKLFLQLNHTETSQRCKGRTEKKSRFSRVFLLQLAWNPVRERIWELPDPPEA